MKTDRPIKNICILILKKCKKKVNMNFITVIFTFKTNDVFVCFFLNFSYTKKKITKSR
jgi:hypothetical protein